MPDPHAQLKVAAPQPWIGGYQPPCHTTVLTLAATKSYPVSGLMSSAGLSNKFLMLVGNPAEID